MKKNYKSVMKWKTGEKKSCVKLHYCKPLTAVTSKDTVITLKVLTRNPFYTIQYSERWEFYTNQKSKTLTMITSKAAVEFSRGRAMLVV